MWPVGMRIRRAGEDFEAERDHTGTASSFSGSASRSNRLGVAICRFEVEARIPEVRRREPWLLYFFQRVPISRICRATDKNGTPRVANREGIGLSY